ncbi:hypothetical protein GE09DRAFT_1089719 [Coniochaeta sp. 2T2.1]|nr:hypothetical protein GE09DRAFT_1089719 [Coniochaeta sp. 2T2.1]
MQVGSSLDCRDWNTSAQGYHRHDLQLAMQSAPHIARCDAARSQDSNYGAQEADYPWLGIPSFTATSRTTKALLCMPLYVLVAVSAPSLFLNSDNISQHYTPLRPKSGLQGISTFSFTISNSISSGALDEFPTSCTTTITTSLLGFTEYLIDPFPFLYCLGRTVYERVIAWFYERMGSWLSSPNGGFTHFVQLEHLGHGVIRRRYLADTNGIWNDGRAHGAVSG